MHTEKEPGPDRTRVLGTGVRVHSLSRLAFLPTCIAPAEGLGELGGKGGGGVEELEKEICSQGLVLK